MTHGLTCSCNSKRSDTVVSVDELAQSANQ